MSINTQQQEAEIEADDLLTEIMLRLPLYAIHRFKLLCKQWHSLITSSGFRKLWHRRNPVGLILHRDYTSHVVCFPLSSTISRTIPSNFIIQQSCNGLLLCRSDSWYHVYNPTTTKYRTLPKLDCKTSMYLAYDPTRSPYYKVIATTFIFPSGDDIVLIQIHVYSSRTCCWTSVLESILPPFWNYKGIYWNGSINWVEDLLYFNIEDQTLIRPIMPAHTGPAWRYYDYLGESRGRLNCVKVRRSIPCFVDVCFVDVYELKRDYSHWVLKYHVSIENCDYSSCSVLSVVHGLEEDDSFLVLKITDKITDKIVRFNIVSKTSEELHVFPARTCYIQAFQDFESQCDV